MINHTPLLLTRMIRQRGMLSEEDAARFFADDYDIDIDEAEAEAEAEVEVKAEVQAEVELAARCADRTPQ